MNPFTCSNRALRVRRNTTRLFCHTSSSSVDSQAVRMHHPMRVAKMTDEIATKVRVEVFEILKQKSNSAMKKITILSKRKGFHKPSATPRKARDDVRPHKQRPGKAENNGHRLKTEDPVTILIEICRLPKCFFTSAHTSDATVYSLHPQDLLFASYGCDELGSGRSQCFLYWLALRGNWQSVKQT